MSHTYLIELYDLIQQHLEDVTDKLQTAQSTEVDHLKGRSSSLEDLQRFLYTHYDRKLPRRLRR